MLIHMIGSFKNFTKLLSSNTRRKKRKKLELKVLKCNSVTIIDRPSLIDKPQMTNLGKDQW